MSVTVTIISEIYKWKEKQTFVNKLEKTLSTETINISFFIFVLTVT